MATFNVLADLSTTPLTRQDLYDAWSTATVSALTASDLASDFLSITVASSFSDAPAVPGPGQCMWVADEQTMFCYHDEIDDTGVSLWLAVGPDVFETAVLLSEPAWPGSLIEPYFDRWVRPVQYTDSVLSDGVTNRMIGNVHSGVPYPLNSRTPETLASGTWVRGGIDGFLFGWIPNPSGTSEAFYQIDESVGLGAAPVDGAHPDNGGKGGLIRVNLDTGRLGTVEPFWGFCGLSLYTLFNADTATDWGFHLRYRFTGFQDQSDRTP